jgi:hypothetical protein
MRRPFANFRIVLPVRRTVGCQGLAVGPLARLEREGQVRPSFDVFHDLAQSPMILKCVSYCTSVGRCCEDHVQIA